MSINRIIISGYLGKDPEHKGDKKYCKFTVATSRRVGDENKTTWHNVVAFNQQAEFLIQYAKMGDFIALEGSMSYDKYTDKQGVERVWPEILAYIIDLPRAKPVAEKVDPLGDL